MHAQPRSQHVKIHLRHAPLMQGIHQQTVDHRPQTGYGLQPLRLQVTQTDRDIGAKAEAKGRDLRLSVGRTFLGLDKDGTPVTLSADAPLSLRQAVLVYDGEAKTYTLLPGSSQELCYLGDTALLEPQELAGEETLRLGTATLKFVPFCGPDFSW
jgi:hypothetical protein